MSKYDRWPFLRELENIFECFNTSLFNGQLSMPVHVVQAEKKVILKFVPESHTLIVGSKFHDLTRIILCEHYLHEMVHMKNHLLGVSDCTVNQYHNAKFLQVAVDVGFYVFKHETLGWSITKFRNDKTLNLVNPPSKISRQNLLTTFRKLKIDFALIKEGEEEVSRVSISSARSKPSFLKYVCQCDSPHNSIRSGRRPDGPNPLRIKCLDCKSLFVCTEEPSPIET